MRNCLQQRIIFDVTAKVENLMQGYLKYSLEIILRPQQKWEKFVHNTTIEDYI